MKIVRLLPVLLAIVLLIACGSKKNRSYAYNISPGSTEYILAEGLGALQKGDLDLAEKKLLEAVTRNPRILTAHNALGLTYLYKKNYPKALEYFNSAIKLNPSFFDAYNSLGLVYLALGDRLKAKESFLTSANALSYPTPENSYSNLAAMELEENNLEDALRYVDKGLELKKEFPPLHNLKGIILERGEKVEEAIVEYQKAISFSKQEQADYYINLGKAYHRLKNRNGALDDLEKALALVKDPQRREELMQLIVEVQKN